MKDYISRLFQSETVMIAFWSGLVLCWYLFAILYSWPALQ